MPKAKGQLAQWSDMLAVLVGVYQDDADAGGPGQPASSPRTTSSACCWPSARTSSTTLRAICSFCWWSNDRLNVLPAIRELFEQLKANYENEVDAQIESAFPLSDEQVGVLVQRLEARTERKVRASVTRGPGADRRGQVCRSATKCGTPRCVASSTTWPAALQLD